MSFSVRRIKLKARMQLALRRKKFGWMLAGEQLWKRSHTELWFGFRPGEDRTFKDNWVSRKSNEELELCSVVSDEYELIKNAILCGAHLVWYADQKQASVSSAVLA